MGKKKSHIPPEGEWDFLRARDGSKHIDNCAEGYGFAGGSNQDLNKTGNNKVEVHHAMCVHACSDATFPKGMTDNHKTYIYASLSQTEWDINGPQNNLGLPRKWAYVEDPKNLGGWDGYPCHQVDHDLYLKTVEKYVTDTIWMTLDKAKDEEKCEDITGENVKKLFDSGSSKWKKFLKARGKEHGGTKASLDYCLNGSVDNSAVKRKKNPRGKGLLPPHQPREDTWHIPFSMAIDGIRKRAKPPAGTSVDRAGLLGIDEDDSD